MVSMGLPPLDRNSSLDRILPPSFSRKAVRVVASGSSTVSAATAWSSRLTSISGISDPPFCGYRQNPGSACSILNRAACLRAKGNGDPIAACEPIRARHPLVRFQFRAQLPEILTHVDPKGLEILRLDALGDQ